MLDGQMDITTMERMDPSVGSVGCVEDSKHESIAMIQCNDQAKKNVALNLFYDWLFMRLPVCRSTRRCSEPGYVLESSIEYWWQTSTTKSNLKNELLTLNG